MSSQLPTDDFAESASAPIMQVPSWAVSLAVHVAILFLFFAIKLPKEIAEELFNIETSQTEDPDSIDYKFDVTHFDKVGNDSPVNVVAPSIAAAQLAGANPTKKFERVINEEMEMKKPSVDTPPEPNRDELTEAFDATGNSEYVGGVEGAIDRLSLEIASSLREKKTLVCWLFDESLSLKERRDGIVDRFERVYEQLGMKELDVDREKSLLTAVASFGEEFHLITEEPIVDATEVADKIRNLKPDESGKEHVFSAVNMLAEKFKSYRTKMRRNMMIIIVTDERGDDFALLEGTIQRLGRYGIKVYCVGDAAPFGREKGFVKWTYEDGDVEYLPTDAGPETVAPERLILPFWGTNPGWDLTRMTSGFGPYALTRLCAETNGLYLIASDEGPKFDQSTMKNYLPDYRPIAVYDREMKASIAKSALVGAARGTMVKAPPRPQLAFDAPNDNVLRVGITEAQKPLAILEYGLANMMRLMEEGEKGTDTLDTPRWKASFDLAMGRVCAMQCRAAGYNIVLANMKANPKSFEKPGSNQWRLVPSNDINAGPKIRKLQKKAIEYLTRVVNTHPGTPWAMLAEHELGQPMGWEWKENTVTVAQMGRVGADGKKGIQLADDKAKEAAKKKAMRLKNRLKPKL